MKPDETVWIPEGAGFYPAMDPRAHCRTGGLVTDVHLARHFVSREQCETWIAGDGRPFVAVEHDLGSSQKE